MQIILTHTPHEEPKTPYVSSFHAFGAGAINTLNAVANGLQVRDQVSLSFDSVIVAQGTGRDVIDFIRTLDLKA